MLTQKVACPSCAAKLKVAANLPAGQNIKCPKCGNGFPLGEDDEPLDTEVVESQPAKKRADDDEYLDEDEVDRPRKKSRKKAKPTARSPLLLVALIGGIVLVLGIGVTAVVAFWPGGDKTPASKKGEPVAANTRTKRGPVAATNAGPAPTSPPADPGNDGRAGGGDAQSFAAGREVFAQHCARCHSAGGSSGSPKGGGRGGMRGPDLSTAGRDHPLEWLKEHVRNPKAHQPDSRMPAFGGRLSEEEQKSLGEYLASLK